jgi:hydroxypyruvate isomerase
VGEVNYRYLFDLIDRVGFGGWIGCEYRPRLTAPGGTSAGLGWFQPYRTKKP